ncbi:MAG: CBS domain-containing protein [Pyrobaculum sp.]
MNCGEVASRPVITITPGETLEHAVEKMARHNVGALVVVDPENPNRPVGILTERDVVLTLAGKAPLTVTVDKVATTHSLIYVYRDQPVEEAIEKMRRFNIRHVVVLEKTGELYGVISIRDIIKHL